MRYCFYETTNLVNGKKYLGIHGSKDFTKDSYIGSGTILREAVKKYGKSNFIRKDIKFFDTQEEAKEFERKAITPEILRSRDYYNIAEGGGGVAKNSKQFYVGKKIYVVNENSISKFLESHPKALQGVPKRLRLDRSKRMKGRVTINDGKEHRMVFPGEELDNYLENGWTLGVTSEYRLKNSESKKGIRMMHKGDKTRHVKEEDISSFLLEGYGFGPSKLSNTLQGKAHRGLVRIYNEHQIKYVRPEEIENYLARGWTKGTPKRIIQKFKNSLGKRVCIYNDLEQKKVLQSEVNSYLKSGWRLGRSPETLERLAKINVESTVVRQKRIKEEASSRRTIYSCSSEYLEWFNGLSDRPGRIHYGVHRFLKEKGMSKDQFLQHMKDIGEV